MSHELADVVAELASRSRGRTPAEDLEHAFETVHRQYGKPHLDTYREATSQEDRILSLERDVIQLRAALLGLMEGLQHAQAAEPRLLAKRIEQTLARLEEPARPKLPPNTLICVQCKAHVPRELTNVTGRGAVCAACWDGQP